MKNLPITVVENLFKRTEVSAELFTGILTALKDYGLKEDATHVINFLETLTTASNFDMTLMFMDSQEKKDLTTILQALKQDSSISTDQLKKV